MRISLFRKAVLFGVLALAPAAASAQTPTDASPATEDAVDKASRANDKARDEASKSPDKAKEGASGVDTATGKSGDRPAQESGTPTGAEKPATDDTTKQMR